MEIHGNYQEIIHDLHTLNYIECRTFVGLYIYFLNIKREINLQRMNCHDQSVE